MDIVFWSSPLPEDKDAIASRPVGAYKISHWMRKHGYDTQVIEYTAFLTEDQLYRATKKFVTDKTLVLGISTTFLAILPYTWSDGKLRNAPEHVVAVAHRLKREYPKLKIVLGGYGAERLSGWGVADVSVMSYTTATEDIFLEYVNHLRTGSPAPFGKLEFPRVAKYVPDDVTKRPRMHYNQARNPKYNIEFDDFKFVEADCVLPQEVLPMDVSRGCIFACRFCQFPHLGKKKMDYVRGMEYIGQEMLSNYEKFGTTNYHLLDDTFNDTEWKLTEFLKTTQSLPFSINYAAYVRAELLERFPDTPHLLQESGAVGVMHGLESLHPHASNLVGKVWSSGKGREYIPHLFHDIWKGQIGQQLAFITGLPKETAGDLENTFKWFVDNRLFNAVIHLLKIYSPGEKEAGGNQNLLSEFDRNSEKYGFRFDRNGDWYNETWTRRQASKFTDELRKKFNHVNHIGAWQMPIMMALGYDKKYLLETVKKDMNWDIIKQQRDNLYQAYFDLLMSR